MELTDIRIKLMERTQGRLQAFCSITLDGCFVIHELKIVGTGDRLFVAMPSRRISARCDQCGVKNHRAAAYCNHCGMRLRDLECSRKLDRKLYADVAHPFTHECRKTIHAKVIEAYHLERERAKMPGYVSKYESLGDDGNACVQENAITRESAGGP